LSDATTVLAANIRRQALKMVHRAKASHIGSALSIVDILAVLYGEVMNFNVNDLKSRTRDRFILSKGHACVAVYGTLAEIGVFPKSLLETYGQDHSTLMNHISHKVPGVEFSTGSLGHGLPFAVGKALSAQAGGELWRTFVLLSDGELDSGANWEAILFAAHHQLSNLVVIIDFNNLQSLDTISATLGLEPLEDKFRSFGCHVKRINGHDHSEIYKALTYVPQKQPLVVIANTTKGKGVSFMENKVEWHYKNPNDDQLKQALEEL